MSQKRLRLVKVVVQPHFVIDDGDQLEERIGEPVQVPAAEWPEYPRRLDALVAELESALED
ncbi:MAG: hypothetical protein ACJ760_10835 [Thermoleophilaceae bacterium]|jgi:hypothetical protein